MAGRDSTRTRRCAVKYVPLCQKILERLSEPDLVAVLEHFGLSNAGTRSRLVRQTCVHLNWDIDRLLAEGGPFPLVHWNRIIKASGGTPRVSPDKTQQELIRVALEAAAQGCEPTKVVYNPGELDRYPGSFDVVKLKWHDDAAPLGKLDRLPECRRGFYAVIDQIRDAPRSFRQKVLYIGQAFDQPVVKRIRQHHQSYEALIRYTLQHRGVLGAELLIMVGEVDYATKRETRLLFRDIENLLISRHRPRFNTKGKSYCGRRLIIINSGDFTPLRSRCFSEPIRG